MEFQHKYLQSIGKCCADCFSFFNKRSNENKYYNTVFNMRFSFSLYFTMAGGYLCMPDLIYISEVFSCIAIGMEC